MNTISLMSHPCFSRNIVNCLEDEQWRNSPPLFFTDVLSWIGLTLFYGCVASVNTVAKRSIHRSKTESYQESYSQHCALLLSRVGVIVTQHSKIWKDLNLSPHSRLKCGIYDYSQVATNSLWKDFWRKAGRYHQDRHLTNKKNCKTYFDISDNFDKLILSFSVKSLPWNTTKINKLL